jgi:argininosuccinate lyase
MPEDVTRLLLLQKRAHPAIHLGIMEKHEQATWGGRFHDRPSDLMVRFSESVSFDRRLAPFDILGSRAHAAMLGKIGVLTGEEADAIRGGLTAILEEIEAGKFVWDEALEDVHMNIERALTVNVPAASKLHTARSRNDQVATDMRLFFKSACASIEENLHHLLSVIVALADRTRSVTVPGYTHLQRAQPVSLAHHLLAYAEMFARDRGRFAVVAEHANFCPLGSGALAGTTLPIDREFVARELGFVDADGEPRLTRNSMDAVADRDIYIEFAAACAVCGTHFSRVAEDLILWSAAEFNFIHLPEAFTTGSSLMPQKKNPDSLELVRGKSARLQGNLHTLLTLVKGLPLTYNRDLQEDKPPVFDSFDQTVACLQVLAGTLDGVEVNAAACAAAVCDPGLVATDLVDFLVGQGVAFRDAHHAVGRLVAQAEAAGVPMNELTDAQANEICGEFGSGWRDILDAEASLAKREGIGMPGPRQVGSEIARWRERLAEANR